MGEQKRKRRQEELRRIDAWLQKLHRDHPVVAWLLAFGALSESSLWQCCSGHFLNGWEGEHD